MLRTIVSGVGGGSVFISYRRELSWTLARLVEDNLTNHGFDTFLDIRDLGSGDFEAKTFREIEERDSFVVLLQPGSLDRIEDAGDWLRREIAHAIAHGRNVVPGNRRWI